VKGNAAVAREGLSFVVGEDLSTRPLLDVYPNKVSAPPLEDSLKKSQTRSDIRAAQERVLSGRYAVNVSRADYWPDVDATGNYYTHRRGFQSDIDWDATIDVGVPIFQGGAVAAQTNFAKSQLRVAEFDLSQTERFAQSDVRRAHIKLQSSISKISALEDSFKKAERSYRLHTKEYRLGLVDNLDVLSALRDLVNRKLDLNQAVLQSKLDLLALLVATEEFTGDMK
jgi:outer membrane protein TolC